MFGGEKIWSELLFVLDADHGFDSDVCSDIRECEFKHWQTWDAGLVQWIHGLCRDNKSEDGGVFYYEPYALQSVSVEY